MDTDVRGKRAAFVTRSTEIRETFGFASPLEVLQAVIFAVIFMDAMGSWWRSGEAAVKLLEYMCEASMECPSCHSQILCRSLAFM